LEQNYSFEKNILLGKIPIKNKKIIQLDSILPLEMKKYFTGANCSVGKIFHLNFRRKKRKLVFKSRNPSSGLGANGPRTGALCDRPARTLSICGAKWRSRPELEGNAKNLVCETCFSFFFEKNLFSLKICATEFGLVAMYEQ